MRIVEFLRDGSLFPKKGKRDTFDSAALIINSETGAQEYRTEWANTDPYETYKGGRLSIGTYAYICGNKRDNGKKVLYVFDSKYFDTIKDSKDLTIKMRTLPSEIPNPNHDNEPIIDCVLVHGDGLEGGWSQGCMTIHPTDWEAFIARFNIGDKGLLHLKEGK